MYYFFKENQKTIISNVMYFLDVYVEVGVLRHRDRLNYGESKRVHKKLPSRVPIRFLQLSCPVPQVVVTVLGYNKLPVTSL